MDAPRLLKAFFLQFNACPGFISDFMPFFVKALTDEFDWAAAMLAIAINSENFPDNSLPRTIHQPCQWLVFVAFINVVAVEVLSGNIASPTDHAPDAGLKLLKPRNVAGTVAGNLTCHLSTAGILVFWLIHIGIHFSVLTSVLMSFILIPILMSIALTSERISFLLTLERMSFLVSI